MWSNQRTLGLEYIELPGGHQSLEIAREGKVKENTVNHSKNGEN